MGKSLNPQPYNIVGGATLFSRGEAQRFCRQVLESESYRDTVTERATKGTLPAAIEALLWYYAYGKPIEQVNMVVQAGQIDLSALSIAELQRKAAEVAAELEEAQAVEDALNVDADGTVTKGPW